MMKKLTAFLFTFIVLNALSQDAKKLYPYRVKDKWGFSNDIGKIYVKAKFDSVGQFYTDLISGIYGATVFYKGKVALIDEKGKYIVPPQFDRLNCIQASGEKKYNFIVQNNNYFGLIDKSLKIIVPLDFDELLQDSRDINFNNYLAKKKNLWYSINIEKKVTQTLLKDTSFIQELIFGGQKAYVFPDFLPKFRDSRNLIVSKSENEQIKNSLPFEIDSIGNNYILNKNYLAIYKGAKMGLVDVKEIKINPAKFVLKPQYDSIAFTCFFGNQIVFHAFNNGMTGIVAKLDSIVLPFKYSKISNFYNNCVITELNGLKGIYDFERKKEVPPKYKFLKFAYSEAAENKLTIFYLYDNGKIDFVSSNGIEFFKN